MTGKPNASGLHAPSWIRDILRHSSTWPAMSKARRAAKKVGRGNDWGYILAYAMAYREGRRQGELEAQRNSLLIVLRKRFSTISTELEARIRDSNGSARLHAAFLQVFDIASPDELAL